MLNRGNENLRWDKLDNTAQLFPVIAREGMSNVYRVSVLLKEEIDQETLQHSLEKVLPYFDVFRVQIKKGIFWYYFEENKRPAPRVVEEDTFPCIFINQYKNNHYLFRVTYFGNRINLEMFHALADGNGALSFLKEITYQYIRERHPELKGRVRNGLVSETSLSSEDSYLSNFKKPEKKTYVTKRAVTIKGIEMPINHLGIIHGIIPVDTIKKAAKAYGVTINQYIVAVYTWAIYKSYLKGRKSKHPISTCVPVNLRPYFGSDTNKNFFVVVSAIFEPEKDEYTFEEVLEIIKKSLSDQITKENLERLFSYNVSNEMNVWLRAFPLFIKQIAMRQVYNASAKANTTTVTNLGVLGTTEPYSDYIERFQAVLSMSKGQNIKMTAISFQNTLTLTFSSRLQERDIQRLFFRKLSEDGVEVTVETNGLYYN